jgi:hypothetical protein
MSSISPGQTTLTPATSCAKRPNKLASAVCATAGRLVPQTRHCSVQCWRLWQWPHTHVWASDTSRTALNRITSDPWSVKISCRRAGSGTCKAALCVRKPCG